MQVNPEAGSKLIQDLLQPLVGLKWIKSRNVMATRYFYFAACNSSGEIDTDHYRIGVECPWRIEKERAILVGSEDYWVRAEDNTDPSWKEGTPHGHLQDQKLCDLLGEIRDGGVVNTGSSLIVQFVEADEYWGFRIGFDVAVVLSVFPASCGQMEWIVTPSGGGGLALMNGKLNRTRCR